MDSLSSLEEQVDFFSIPFWEQNKLSYSST